MAKLGDTTVFGDLDVSGSVGFGVYDSVADVPDIPVGSVVYVRGEGLYKKTQYESAPNNPTTLGDNLFLAKGTGTNINASNYVSWDNTQMNDSAYSFDGTRVTFETGGSYEVTADADFNSSSTRANPNLYIEYYDGNSWDWAGVLGRSGYIRAASGHNNASVHAHAVIEVSDGDHIRVRGAQEADGGTIVPNRSMFFIKKFNR